MLEDNFYRTIGFILPVHKYICHTRLMTEYLVDKNALTSCTYIQLIEYYKGRTIYIFNDAIYAWKCEKYKADIEVIASKAR